MNRLSFKPLKGIIALGISVFMLLIGELFLRFTYPEKISSVRNLAFQHDADFLISMMPGVTKSFTHDSENGGMTISWSTNSASFRGDEMKENPDRRIIVYGDSNVHARFSELENTFPQALQKYLTANIPLDIEVLNAGIIGAGPDQNLIRFEKDVIMYEPDLVIFQIFADNDYGDIVRNRLFELDANDRLVRTSFEISPDEHLAVAKSGGSRFPRNLLIVRAAKRLLGLGGLAKEKLAEKPDNTLSPEQELETLLAINFKEFEVYSRGEDRQFSHFADHYDLDIAIEPNGPSAITKKTLMSLVLAVAKSVADTHGIEFLVLVLPSVRDMSNSNSILHYEHLRTYPEYKRTNLTDPVINACQSNDIDCINLFVTYNGPDASSFYFRGKNDHWNDKGQDIAAKEVSRFILEKRMIHP